MAGLDPDKHLGKTLDEMEPYLLEVSVVSSILETFCAHHHPKVNIYRGK